MKVAVTSCGGVAPQTSVSEAVRRFLMGKLELMSVPNALDAKMITRILSRKY